MRHSETIDVPTVPERGDGCASRFTLERLQAGEIQGDAAQALHHHLRGCSRCGAMQVQLGEDTRSFRERVSPDLFAQILTRGLQEIPLETVAPVPTFLEWLQSWMAAALDWMIRPIVAGPALAVIALLMVLPASLRLVGDPAPKIGIRSGYQDPGPMDVLVLRGQQVAPARSGEIFREGDRLQFVVRPGSRRFLHLVSVDSAGNLSAFYPQSGGESVALGPGSEIMLPGSVQLDSALGYERLFAIFTERPILTERVGEAVDSLSQGHRGTLPWDRWTSLPLDDAAQVTFLLVKE